MKFPFVTTISMKSLMMSLCLIAISGNLHSEWLYGPRNSEGQNNSQYQSLSDLLLQVQRLRDELQELRGKMEQQGHIIDELRRELRGSTSIRNVPTANAPVVPVPNAVAAPRTTTNVPNDDSSSLIPPPHTYSPTYRPAPVVNTPPPFRNSESETDSYQAALSQLKNGQYANSIAGFRAFTTAYPTSVLAGNAQYWLGEAYYVTRDFDAAIAAFTQVLEQYPDSNKVAAATLKLGFISHEKGEIAQATEFLEQVTQRFPGSTESKLATQRLELIKGRR